MSDVDDSHFRLPLPPPGLEEEGDVLFIRAQGPPRDGNRDAEDILMRRVPARSAARFRGAAGGRGLTHGQYLAALVDLHERMRGLAEQGNQAVAQELETLGLATVTV